MSVQKFYGKSSRAVLKEVRAVLGDDAVIISNRTNGSNVEVLAMAANAMDSLVEAADAMPTRRVDVGVRVETATEPESFENYLRLNPGVRNGVYLYNGILTHQYIGETYNIPYKDLDLLIAANTF